MKTRTVESLLSAINDQMVKARNRIDLERSSAPDGNLIDSEELYVQRRILRVLREILEQA
jgi:hypothetical protein